MRKLIGLGCVAGIITLAVLIGQRMSTDAMAVVIGVVFGVAASIPTSLLIVAATRSPRPREDPYRSVGPDPRPPAQPNIYIVNPPTGTMLGSQPRPQLPEPYSFAMPTTVMPAERRYTIVGDDDYPEN